MSIFTARRERRARGALGESDKLVELVEACKLRRIRSGATKRERAQNEIIDAPPILGGIMRDSNANERHRIDSIKALDARNTTARYARVANSTGTKPDK
jgi:hypothetical protein